MFASNSIQPLESTLIFFFLFPHFNIVEKIIGEQNVKALTKYFLIFKGASREVQAHYYDVLNKDVTADRAYFKSSRMSVYIGANYTDCSWARNKLSPLYRESSQFSYLMGLTYVLSESVKREVPKENTSGIINR